MKHMRRLIKEGFDIDLDWYQCRDAVADAKEHIVNYLNEVAENGDGEEQYISDIGMEITMNENNDGVWNYSGTAASIKDAIKNWGLSDYMVKYCKEELGMDIGKDFWENPEKFWCICMINLCEIIWNAVVNDLKLDKDGDTIVITKELADKVESFLSKKYETINQLGLCD